MMNGKVYLGLSLLLLLPACFKDAQGSSTLFIQAILNSAALTSVIKTLTPVINGIIKDELHLGKEDGAEFFIPKPVQKLTLYLVDDIVKDGEPLLFDTIEKLKLMATQPKNVSYVSKVDFFGDQHDELVVLIDDPAGELLHLNQEIKTAVHQLDDDYKKTHHRDLYDRAKSERYDYRPHIGLGRIRLSSITGCIEAKIEDKTQVGTTLERIKGRIKKEALDVVKKSSNPKLSFHKIGIWDLEKRTHIKEWAI